MTNPCLYRSIFMSSALFHSSLVSSLDCQVLYSGDYGSSAHTASSEIPLYSSFVPGFPCWRMPCQSYTFLSGFSLSFCFIISNSIHADKTGNIQYLLPFPTVLMKQKMNLKNNRKQTKKKIQQNRNKRIIPSLKMMQIG